MTNPSFDPTIAGPQDIPPVSSAAAAERERNLQSAAAGETATQAAHGDAASAQAAPGDDDPSAHVGPGDDDDHKHHKGRHRR